MFLHIFIRLKEQFPCQQPGLSGFPVKTSMDKAAGKFPVICAAPIPVPVPTKRKENFSFH